MKNIYSCKPAFFVLFLSLCLPLLLFVSCATRINGTISADGSAELAINMSLEPRITALIRSLSSASGQTDVLLLDGPAMAASMSNAPGVAFVTLRNTTPSAVEGTMRISDINFFLAVADSNFIVYEQSGRLEINITRENGHVILDLLSPEIFDYLNALMAPIASGEEMSKTEYLELIASFYNKPVSDEIAASRILVSIEFPGSITAVKGGTHSGRRADFNISLLDFLVLETPINYEVRWR